METLFHMILLLGYLVVFGLMIWHGMIERRLKVEEAQKLVDRLKA